MRVTEGTLGGELCDEFGPFCSEDVRASERAVTATYGDSVDAFFDEVVCGRQASLERSERNRPCRPNERTTLIDDGNISNVRWS